MLDDTNRIEELERENAILRSRLSELNLLQSEIRRTKATSRESEERFRMIFEFAPDAYYLSDLQGNFLDGNKAAEKLIGSPRESLIGKNFMKLDLLPVSQISKAAKLLALNALGKATGPDEFILKQVNGDRVPVAISTYPVKIADKTIVLGIARDISDHKRMSDELNATRQELDLIRDKIGEVVIQVDEKGDIVNVNHQIETIFGYSRKEVLSSNFYRLGIVSQKDSNVVAQALGGAVGGGSLPRLTFEARKKDGTPVMIEASINVIRKTDHETIYIIARAIPDRNE